MIKIFKFYIKKMEEEIIIPNLYPNKLLREINEVKRQSLINEVKGQSPIEQASAPNYSEYEKDVLKTEINNLRINNFLSEKKVLEETL